jgi:hypothetical protein
MSAEQPERFAPPPPMAPRHSKGETRALAKLTGEAVWLADTVKGMQRTAAVLPLTIQLEVNNLQEVNDLLRFKLHEETLAGVIHGPP